MANTPVALGASAAVNAIVMLQVMLYPREMIYIYMVLPIPAAAFGLLYIFGDMFGMLGVGNSAFAEGRGRGLRFERGGARGEGKMKSCVAHAPATNGGLLHKCDLPYGIMHCMQYVLMRERRMLMAGGL